MTGTKHKKGRKEPDSPALKEGSHVHIVRLKKNGIITELISDERYRVCIGSLVIACNASELTASTASQVMSSKAPKTGVPKTTAPPAKLDLHGCTVDEAIQKLESWLDRAILADLSKIKVIHGFGSGKVQKAVHHYLTGISAVAKFRINPLNHGETEIFL